jgi:serine/threonine protein kinase
MRDCNRTIQILNGLEAIHSHKGFHRHLTPTNILFDDEKRQTLKISDIGVFGCPHTSPIPLTDASIRLVRLFVSLVLAGQLLSDVHIYVYLSLYVCMYVWYTMQYIVIIHQHMYQHIVHQSN